MHGGGEVRGAVVVRWRRGADDDSREVDDICHDEVRGEEIGRLTAGEEARCWKTVWKSSQNWRSVDLGLHGIDSGSSMRNQAEELVACGVEVVGGKSESWEPRIGIQPWKMDRKTAEGSSSFIAFQIDE